MNMGCRHLTTMYESNFAQICVVLVEKQDLQYLLQNNSMVDNYTSSFLKLSCLFKIRSASRNDANGINPGSNSKITDKHAAEGSKTACLEVN